MWTSLVAVAVLSSVTIWVTRVVVRSGCAGRLFSFLSPTFAGGVIWFRAVFADGSSSGSGRVVVVVLSRWSSLVVVVVVVHQECGFV